MYGKGKILMYIKRRNQMDQYTQLLIEIRKYYNNFNPGHMTENNLRSMLNYCQAKKSKKKFNTIKPDIVSKDYTDNWEAHEIIDYKKHISFDILEKQELENNLLIKENI